MDLSIIIGGRFPKSQILDIIHHVVNLICQAMADSFQQTQNHFSKTKLYNPLFTSFYSKMIHYVWHYVFAKVSKVSKSLLSLWIKSGFEMPHFLHWVSWLDLVMSRWIAYSSLALNYLDHPEFIAKLLIGFHSNTGNICTFWSLSTHLSNPTDSFFASLLLFPLIKDKRLDLLRSLMSPHHITKLAHC